MENDAKYTCPACHAKTCSLECVKRHKLRLECSGKVDPTKFVPNKELSSSQAVVNRDYNYLLNFERQISLRKEDVKSSAKNMFKRKQGANNGNKRQRPNPELVDSRISQINRVFPNNPQTSIKRENTLVVHLPAGMSRANQNKSGFDKKAGAYIWTVEWVPVDADGKPHKGFISYRLKETTKLRDAVPLNVLQNSVVGQDFPKEHLQFYLANCIGTSTERSVIALDPGSTISSALSGKVVLEYPQIFITTDSLIWAKYVQDEKTAYGAEYSSESEMSSESSSDNLDSESSDSEDSEPEEESSKAPEAVVEKADVSERVVNPASVLQPVVSSGLAQLSYESDQDSEEGVSA